ncbi:adenosylcobyric acid synthase [Enterococcus sp. PF1-24]|uniref:cobyric acid synthase n=1 Tax=unclassified Enterococcus TaxID=2608891 RepID=UPI0024737583|nr:MULTISPECIES: cobyric acid synthase [unclassified Enterococcus]MDH6363376.1 adenosylcobyric acid synthase [Enterococcus sp. PFB1-1]MDH6400323.1 adenosylcobyric acid synthase [Enterococcus sp. PF1-24]
MGKSIMVQGTASDSGKSIVVAGLCRIFHQDGLKVIPFKSQNMALNSYITATGAEMGRAQVFQAEAAGVEPDVRMNPVLLKPTSDRKSQVIFNGKVLQDMDAVAYHQFKPQLSSEISDLYQELLKENDAIVIEGAGSPAEINLNDRDIANMGMAKIADAPVLLVADIDKGGVFAAIYGTIMLLKPEERRRVQGIIINKFRGDIALLEPGLKMIEDLTDVPVVGVIPYAQLNIEDEDSVALKNVNRFYDSRKALDIAVIGLTKISNFTDFKSLELEEDVSLRYVFPGDVLGQPDLVILPGSKNTIDDCLYLQESGLATELMKLQQAGTRIIGICGGYQLLGKMLHDEEQIESSHGSLAGLGLLNVETYFEAEKTTTQVIGTVTDLTISGYEIHMGRTLNHEEKYFAKITEANGEKVNKADGAISSDGRIIGTYLHGIFDNNSWKRQLLNEIRQEKGLAPLAELPLSYQAYKNLQYDKLADLLREHLDMEKIVAIMEDWGEN